MFLTATLRGGALSKFQRAEHGVGWGGMGWEGELPESAWLGVQSPLEFSHRTMKRITSKAQAVTPLPGNRTGQTECGKDNPEDPERNGPHDLWVLL